MTRLLLWLVFASLGVVLLAAATLLLYRCLRSWRERVAKRRREELLSLLDRIAAGDSDRRTWAKLKERAHQHPALFLQVLLGFLDHCRLDAVLVDASWQQLLTSSGLLTYIDRCLHSRTAWKKTLALNSAIRLGNASLHAEACRLLEHPDQLVQFTAAEYLLSQDDFTCLPQLVPLLGQAEDWYLERYYPYFSHHLEVVPELLQLAEQLPEEHQLVLHKLLCHMPCTEVDAHFKQAMRTARHPVREVAAEYLLEYDPDFLVDGGFHLDIRPYIRSLALRACAQAKFDLELIERLLQHYHDQFEVIRRSVQATLADMARRSRATMTYLRSLMLDERAALHHPAVARLFEQLDYTLVCVRELGLPQVRQEATSILTRVIEAGELVDLLNCLRTEPRQRATQVLDLLVKHASVAALEQHRDLLDRLPEDRRLRLTALLPPPEKTEHIAEQRNLRQSKLLAGLLLLLTLGPLLIYAYSNRDLLVHGQWQLFAANLVLAFNQVIVWYVATINSFYLLLAALSAIGLGWYLRRKRAWTLGDYFRRRLVPPISIIAPCYNESQTIIESINSLLNIQHPRFEVVVVNDGSRDDTLDRLISYYGLEKSNPVYRQLLPTAKVRSTYSSPRFPNLVVMDKVNGGKADALNAGLNLTRYPYFCSIDADTLIDGDSLIHASAPFSFEHTTCAATGCNIRVVNDCSVDNGVIEQRRLPGRWVERFQVLEYMRAFTGGRIGWSFANGLLIISGAYGLFKKQIAFKLGGYSTRRSRNHGTVGEDMELVVEYHRFLAEQGLPYQIIYCPDASGWTQVPASLSILRRQRDRWHRGLIEVLLGNLRMLFNPKYRDAGMLAFPYFFCFEFLGSWIEALGYLSVVIAALVGLLNPLVFALLFVFSVAFGTLISLISLFLEERQQPVYSGRELLVLIGCCLLENLGYRQFTAWWRFRATLNLIFRQSTWGRMERQQFSGSTGATERNPSRAPFAS